MNSNGGSFGRSEARRVQSGGEFDKYAEEDDEDYEDVFGKPNGTSEWGCDLHAVHSASFSSHRTVGRAP